MLWASSFPRHRFIRDGEQLNRYQAGGWAGSSCPPPSTVGTRTRLATGAGTGCSPRRTTGRPREMRSPGRASSSTWAATPSSAIPSRHPHHPGASRPQGRPHHHDLCACAGAGVARARGARLTHFGATYRVCISATPREASAPQHPSAGRSGGATLRFASVVMKISWRCAVDLCGLDNGC